MKTAEDVFTYPPRILPYVAATATRRTARSCRSSPCRSPGAGRRTSRGSKNGTSLREFRKVDDPDVRPREPEGCPRADRDHRHGGRRGEGRLRRHDRRPAGRGLRQPLPDRRHVRRPGEPERPTGVRRPGGRGPGGAGRLPDGQLLQGPEPQRVLPGADEHRADHDPRGRRTGADQHPRWVRVRPAEVPGTGEAVPVLPRVDHDPVRRPDHPALPADGGDRVGQRPCVAGDPVRVHGVRHVPDAPVLRDDPQGARGGRDPRRRLTVDASSGRCSCPCRSRPSPR